MMTNKVLHSVLRCIVLFAMVSCQKDKPDVDDGIPGVTTNDYTYTWSNVAMGGGGFVSGIITSETEKNLIYMRTDVGGAYRWIEETASWKPLTDFVGPNETALLGIESVAIDPVNTNKVYLAAGTSYWNNGLSAILISNDYGETFEKVEVTSQFKIHGNGMGRQTGERLAVDPNKPEILFYGTRSNGLWKSTNSGETWTQISGFPVTTTANANGICFVQFNDAASAEGQASSTIYVGVSRKNETNLFLSSDGGETWSGLPNAPVDYMPMRCLLVDQKLYITYADAEGPWNCTDGQLIKYSLSSETWDDITPESGNAYNGISTNADNSLLIATSMNKWINQGSAYGDEIYRSTDDGASWSRMFQDENASVSEGEVGWMKNGSIHWTGDLKIDPFNDDRAFIVSGNGVFSTNNLKTTAPQWTFTSKGLEETVPYDIVSIPNDGTAENYVVSIIADYDGYLHKSIFEFPEKRHFPSIGTSSSVDCAFQKPNIVVRAGGESENKAMYYSEDYGETWKRVLTSGIGKYSGNLAVSADGESIVWCPANSSTTYVTTNFGQSWTKSSGINSSVYPVADPVNPLVIYAYSSSGKFYRSFDKGATFTSSLTNVSGGSSQIEALPFTSEGGHVLIAAKGNGLYFSDNYGFNFEKIETVSSCLAVGSGIGPAGSDYPSIFIFGETTTDPTLGIHRSDDAGITWVRINDDAHQYGGLANGNFIKGDNNVFGRVYMSSAGRGIVVGNIE